MLAGRGANFLASTFLHLCSVLVDMPEKGDSDRGTSAQECPSRASMSQLVGIPTREHVTSCGLFLRGIPLILRAIDRSISRSQNLHLRQRCNLQKKKNSSCEASNGTVCSSSVVGLGDQPLVDSSHSTTPSHVALLAMRSMMWTNSLALPKHSILATILGTWLRLISSSTGTCIRWQNRII